MHAKAEILVGGMFPKLELALDNSSRTCDGALISALVSLLALRSFLVGAITRRFYYFLHSNKQTFISGCKQVANSGQFLYSAVRQHGTP